MAMESGLITPRPSSPSSTLRLSTFYEYHNAPEVAPAHGLEHDDHVYPSSDKCTVVNCQSNTPSYMAKPSYEASNKPPRIIFGMKVQTFIIVTILFVCIIVGAAVGGAVGGKNMNGGNTADQAAGHSTTISSSTGSLQTVVAGSSVTTSQPSTTTSTAATPTPSSDCPGSNNTLYSYTNTSSEGNGNAGLNFTKHCGMESPLFSDTLSARNITAAFVYTFDDCVGACASYNYYSSSSNCTVAVYKASARRPANCWIGYADLDGVTGLVHGGSSKQYGPKWTLQFSVQGFDPGVAAFFMPPIVIESGI